MPLLENTIETIQNDSKGLSALVWILGEYGEHSEYSSYLIEDIINNYTESENNELINSLLLASCKLFFKNPGEMQEILSKLFELIFNNFNDIDLKDRASYYYHLMKTDMEEANYIICGEKTTVEEFSDNKNIALAQIFKEFNSLSVLYNKPEEKFIKKYLEENDFNKKDKEEEIEDKEQENIQVIQVDETDKEPEFSIFKYDKSKLNGKAILGEEFNEIWENYPIKITKEFTNIPEEIDVEEFKSYLAEENVFTKKYNEENKVLEMFLYSLDVSLLNSKYYFLLFFINTID